MSDGKAGQMGAGMAWAFAIGAVLVTAVVGYFIHGTVGWLLDTAILGGAGWAAVYMTQASTGKGIVAFLVAGLVAGVLAFIVFKMAVGAVTSGMGSAMGDIAKAGGSQNAALDAQLKQAGDAVGGAMGTIAGVMAFIFVLLHTFIVGMIGCFIGGAMKKSSAGGASAAKAA